MFEALLAASSLLSTVSGHGAMVWPYTWFDHEGYGLTEKSMCMPGCNLNQNTLGGLGCQCFWFTNYTFIPDEATLNAPELRTFHDIDGVDWTKKHPWRHPGAAEVYSPCGVAGGNPEGCDSSCPFDAYEGGPAAEVYDFPWNPKKTPWKAGSVAKVGWGITANHGGGYSYRLCKIPPEGRSGLTEECFQQTPLRFHGDIQWAQFGWNGKRVKFNATRTTEGTVPAGSQWTKNPIPACDSFHGGFYDDLDSGCPDGPTDVQFPSPNAEEGLYGYGGSAFDFNRAFSFTIMDEVEVPEDLEEGDYVLSFRWDCEQTPQVWNTCSTVKIVQ